MEVVELLKELIKRQSVTPNECGIYDIIKAELADFEAIEIEKNGVKNLFLYKDFASGNSSLGVSNSPLELHSADSANFGRSQTPSLASRPKFAESYESQTENPSVVLNNKNGESANPAQQTIEGIAVEVAEFLPNFECETRLGVCEHSKFGKSMQDAPKSELKNTRVSMQKIHLCFAGHIDVVPAGFGWSVPPFDALIKDRVIYGRGAQDMKGGVAAFVSVLQKVKNFNGILSVLLTSDEEGDGIFGTKIMLEALKERGLLPHFAIVAEPTCEKKLGDSIKIGRRGSVNGVLKIYGTQGHTAYPYKCVNPLDLIAPILAQISSKDLDSGSEYFAPSKIVITDIRGGIEATNVTPAELKLMFNVRNNPLTDKNAIQNYVESLLKNAGIKKYDLSLNQGSFPFITDSNMLLDSLSRAVKSRTNITPRPNTEGGTSDARYFSAFGVEVVEFGLVNDRIHATDECVKIADLETLRDIFVDFIADFDNTIKSNQSRGRTPKSHNNRVRDSRNSTNPPKQTIEGIAVEVAEFLPNFECETRLGVCEHSKFGKSMQDAPKSKLPTQDEFTTH